jgi:hypothetical protein
MSALRFAGAAGRTLAVVALFLPAAVAWAEPPAPPAKLAPTFLEGKDSFYQELTTITRQAMTVTGMKHQQEQKLTLYLRWTPTGKENGKYVIVRKILGVKMAIDIAGNRISFDSTKPQQPKNPMSEFFNQLPGAEFTLTITKDKNGRYTVESVQGMDELARKMGQSNQAMLPLLHKILNENTVRQMTEPMLTVIPPHGIVPAAGSWSGSSTVDAGAIGSYTTENKYSYGGQPRGVARITVKTGIKYTPPAGNLGGVLPFRIVKANINGKDSGGTIRLDLQKGRIVSSDLTTRLEGDMVINVAKMNTAVELSQTQEFRLRTTDTNPLAGTK